MILSLLQAFTLSSLYGLTQLCAPTDPGTVPGGTTTTTLPPCCRTDIYMDTEKRALFNPALTSCPNDANFICSPATDVSTVPTMIVVNGNLVLATGPNGTNSLSTISCNARKQWQTATGVIVDKIACK